MISGPHGFQARVLHWLKKKRENPTGQPKGSALLGRNNLRASSQPELRLPDHYDAFEESERSIRESQYQRQTLAPAVTPRAPRVSHRVSVRSS